MRNKKLKFSGKVAAHDNSLGEDVEIENLRNRVVDEAPERANHIRYIFVKFDSYSLISYYF